MKNYYPILVSKKGETVALQHLAQTVKDNVCPIIEIIEDTFYKTVTDRKTNAKSKEYSKDFEKFLKTHWSFFDNQIIFDFSILENFNNHIGFIKNLISSVTKGGVNVLLAVQQNSSTEYLLLVKDFLNKFGGGVCIRTSNNSGGFLTLNDSINKLISELNVSSENSILLLDAGQVNKDSYTILASMLGFAIRSLSIPINKWKAIVVSGSSFPENLMDIDVSDDAQPLTRYEALLWANLITPSDLSDVKYSDYGVRHSVYSNVGYAGTVSLKYSTKSEFIIFRGKKTGDDVLGHRQYVAHCKKLINSDYYSGEEFSWGDLQFFEIGSQNPQNEKSKTGNSTNWIQYSQNHHITIIESLV